MKQRVKLKFNEKIIEALVEVVDREGATFYKYKGIYYSERFLDKSDTVKTEVKNPKKKDKKNKEDKADVQITA